MKTIIAILLLFAVTANAQTIVPIVKGGTGASTFSAAQYNLGYHNAVLSTDTTTTADSLINTPLRVWVDSNEVWNIHAVIQADVDSATGLKVGVTVPSGTLKVTAFGNTTSTAAFQLSKLTTSDSGSAAFLTAAGLYGTIIVDGTIRVGATSGYVMIQFETVTSGLITFEADSYIEAWRKQ